MSPRNFSRLFKEAVGVAPAKAVERLRVDTARAALESDLDTSRVGAVARAVERLEGARRDAGVELLEALARVLA